MTKTAFWTKIALAACSSLLFNISTIAASLSEQDELMANGAHNVRRINLGSPAVTQLNYDVEMRFPEVAISGDKIKRLKQQGWRQCEPEKARWEHFGDYAATPRRLVHQQLLSFAKNDKYMAIGMQYDSKLPAVDPSEQTPDNNTQKVYILLYDLAEDEVRNQMKAFVDRCLSQVEKRGQVLH